MPLFGITMTTRRKVLLTLTGGSLTALAVAMKKEDFDLNSVGALRFGRAFFTAFSIVADYRLNVYSHPLLKDPSSSQEEITKLWTTAHQRSAERLLSLCRANRGVFIKVGQHLGALDYLLPRPYVETLRVLHSQAPTSTLEEVYQVLREDLGVKDPCQVFSRFDPEPLGAASLAQVYKAELRETGEVVAVKVQHPKVRAHSYVDMKTMELLVRAAAAIFPDFKLLWLVEETKRNLPRELDFLHEGKNADLLRNLTGRGSPWLRIPKIYWPLSSSRVLVMEYCEGGQVNDLDYMTRNGISSRDVAEKVGALYSEMIFTHGFVHCDPHPGNILVKKKSGTKGDVEVALLDHGLYTTLSPEFRYNYANFWLSIIQSDVPGIRKHGESLGVNEKLSGLFACMVTARSWESLSSKEGISRAVTAEEETRIRTSISNFLPQISEILDQVPRPMVLIFKTNDLIRSIEHSLKTSKTMASFTTMSKFCIRAVYGEEYRRCGLGSNKHWWCYRFPVIEKWLLLRVAVFEVWLWLKSWYTQIRGFDKLELRTMTISSNNDRVLM